MICPRCYSEFRKGPGSCPECGVKLARTVSGVIKTSAVMITDHGEPEFFSSVQDVPEPLRTQLLEITNGHNSGTIVIADQAGKDQIAQVMTRREQERQRTVLAESETPHGWSRFHWIAWAGAGAVLLTGGAIAAIFLVH